MSRDYFDWTTIEDDIVVPEQAAIAVYCNPEGAIVLRQAGRYGSDEDTTMVLHPSHALSLARAILERAGLDVEIVPLTASPSQSAGQSIDDDAKKDRTAAERQRRHRQRNASVTERNAVTDRDSDRESDRDTVTLRAELDLNGEQQNALAH